MTDGNALLALADKMAITEVIYTYGDCVDRRDFEGVIQCFHPDGLYKYLADGTPTPVRAFFESQADAGSGMIETMHHTSNILIRTDGDRAQAQCYLLAHHLMSEDCPPFPPLFPHTGRPYAVLIGARYHDRFERRDGEWKIFQRTLHFEWDAQVQTPVVSGPLANTTGIVPGIF